MTNEQPDEFSRDLGYLARFLDKLAAHAGTLPGERGARLAQLIAEEGERWSEISALLGGEASVAAAPRGEPAPEEGVRPSLTVGSLVDAT